MNNVLMATLKWIEQILTELVAFGTQDKKIVMVDDNQIHLIKGGM